MAKFASERSQELFFSRISYGSVHQGEVVVSVVRANGIRVTCLSSSPRLSVPSVKEGHAFVLVGDNSIRCRGSWVTIELESNGQGGERKLRALRASGGDELYSIAVLTT